MEHFMAMAQLQFMLMIYLLLGVFMRKYNIVTAQARPYFGDFLILITLPCMVFASFNRTFSFSDLFAAGAILIISFGVQMGSDLIGRVIYRKMPFGRQAVMRYGTMISNAGFAGLPQVEAIFGQTGLFYGSIYLLPLRISMWSAGISLFMQTNWQTKLKNVATNPGIMAVFLGLIRMLLQIQLPAVVDGAIASIGNITTPLSMIVIGMILADIPIRSLLDKDVFVLAAVRNIALPFLLLGILRLLVVDPLVTGVAVVLTAMPVGSTTSVLAQKYNADYFFASKCVFVSTVLSLITVPFVCLFL